MKYIVTRTSNYGDEDPKVKGVQKELLPYHEFFWHGERIEKEELKEAYTIDINSIEELHQFIKECAHSIIVSIPDSDGYGFQLPEIEVYDDYRE